MKNRHEMISGNQVIAFMALALFFASAANNTSQAQTYLPFPAESNSIIWKYNIYNNNVNGTRQYMYYGTDTVAQGNVYKKILRSYNYTVTSGMNTPYVVEAYDLHCCYVRQSTQGVIYFFKDGQEQIYFDLNIQIGDTIPPDWVIVSSNSSPTYRIIQSIDTVYDTENVAHRRYNIWEYNSAFIEGIGSTFSFESLVPSDNGIPFISLSCVSEEEVNIYPSGAVICNSLVSPNSIMEDRNANGIYLFPNPSNGLFTLSMPMGNYSLEVFSAMGQLVYSSNLQGSSNHQMDLSNAAKGIYTVRVRGAESTHSQRIIIQ